MWRSFFLQCSLATCIPGEERETEDEKPVGYLYNAETESYRVHGSLHIIYLQSMTLLYFLRGSHDGSEAALAPLLTCSF